MNTSAKYQLGDTIGKGGMGAILQAEERSLERSVAMKVMLETKQNSAQARHRFLREAKVLARLDHPNIVPIHELGTDDQGRLFYTMKLIRGVTLRAVLKQIKKGDRQTVADYPLSQLLGIFQKVCDAVAFAHSKGIIHRDLKPDNIMLGTFGEVLVLDWGLAKFVKDANAPGPADKDEEIEMETMSGEANSVVPADAPKLSENFSLTLPGVVMGTPQFMAPEQASGKIDEQDHRSDIYALGAMLYNILTLRAPVGGTTVQEILERIKSGQIPLPVSYNDAGALESDGLKSKAEIVLAHCPAGKVPEALSAVAMKAMQLEKSDRYQSVEELQREIAAYQNGFATEAEKAGAWTLLSLFVKRHRAVAASLAASVVLLAVVSTAFTVKVVGERNRAEGNLARLRATAPTFQGQAQALMEQGKFDEALEKISFAIGLAGDRADYRLFRANLLQSGKRIDEALREYQQVLKLRPEDKVAKKNLALCEELLRENDGAKPRKREIQMKLVNALISQGRQIEAAPLSLMLGKGQGDIEPAIRARLKEYASQLKWNDNNLRRLPDGNFSLFLYGFNIGDLSKLKEFPISDLNLNATAFSDLAQIQGMPLSVLSLDDTRVIDLAPLHGMKLNTLNITRTKITNLVPLKGMPLKDFCLSMTPVSDLSPLQGMAIERLDVMGCLKLINIGPLKGMPLKYLNLDVSSTIDLAPLEKCEQLEVLHLPRSHRNLGRLRQLPKLRKVYAINRKGEKTEQVAKDLWRDYDVLQGAPSSLWLQIEKQSAQQQWGEALANLMRLHAQFGASDFVKKMNQQEIARLTAELAAKPVNLLGYVPLDISSGFNANIIGSRWHSAPDLFGSHSNAWFADAMTQQGVKPGNRLPVDGVVILTNSQPPATCHLRLAPYQNAILLTDSQGWQPKAIRVELPTLFRRKYRELKILHSSSYGMGIIKMKLEDEMGLKSDHKLQLIGFWHANQISKYPDGVTPALTAPLPNYGTGGTVFMMCQTVRIDSQRLIKSLTFEFESFGQAGLDGSMPAGRFTAAIFAISALPSEVK